MSLRRPLSDVLLGQVFPLLSQTHTTQHQNQRKRMKLMKTPMVGFSFPCISAWQCSSSRRVLQEWLSRWGRLVRRQRGKWYAFIKLCVSFFDNSEQMLFMKTQIMTMWYTTTRTATTIGDDILALFWYWYILYNTMFNIIHSFRFSYWICSFALSQRWGLLGTRELQASQERLQWPSLHPRSQRR
jgi:hypothetical protein